MKNYKNGTFKRMVSLFSLILITFSGCLDFPLLENEITSNEIASGGITGNAIASNEIGSDKSLQANTKSIEDLQREIALSDESLLKLSEERDVFNYKFLTKAAKRFAQSMGKIEKSKEPFATTFIRDIDGNISAFMAVFSRVRENTSVSFARMAGKLEETNEKLNKAGNEKDYNKVIEETGKLRNSEDFLTVIVGANPFTVRLVSLREGFPPSAYKSFSDKNISNSSKKGELPLQSGELFYEPRMAKGYDFGYIYRERNQIFLLPSAAYPMGRVMKQDKYVSLKEKRARGKIEELKKNAETKRNSDKKENKNTKDYENSLYMASLTSYAEKWGKLAALMDEKIETICTNCTASTSLTIKSGFLKQTSENQEEVTRRWQQGEDESFYDYFDSECYYKYSGGYVEAVDSCDGFLDSCCSTGGDEYAAEWDDYKIPSGVRSPVVTSCIESCYCDYAYSYTSRSGAVLTGVPTLYQHISGYTECAYRNGGRVPYVVGCVPIAGTMLLAWYDSLGWNRLGEDFRSSTPITLSQTEKDECANEASKAYSVCTDKGGSYTECSFQYKTTYNDCIEVERGDETYPLNWQDLADSLRNDYGMLTDIECSEYGVPKPTGSWIGQLKDALENYLDEKNYNYSIDKVEVYRENELRDNFERIKTNIDNQRPVVLSFCSGDSTTCDTIGDDSNHEALITGYFESNGEYIYIDTGNGVNETSEWDIGDGDVRLLYVELESSGNGNRWCGADDLVGFYYPTDDSWDISGFNYTGFPNYDSYYGRMTHSGEDLDTDIIEEIEGNNCNLVYAEENYISGSGRSESECSDEGELEEEDPPPSIEDGLPPI